MEVLYQMYPNELIDKNDIKLFMYCGHENMPTKCYCGCGSNYLFTSDHQMNNYAKHDAFRFFKNAIHLKRFRKTI